VVIGVVGARGGAGASTLAALVAARGARRTAAALVDADPVAGGIDVLVGLEDAPGARWPDLAQARGEVDGRDVLALLPRWGRVAVLSADRSRAAGLDAAVAADVVRAVAAVVGLVVLDLGREAVLGGVAPLGSCDRVAVVAARDLRSVAGTLALRDALAGCGADLGLVVRGPAPGGLGVAELADAVDLPLLWSGRADRGVARAAEQGVVVGRGPAGRAAAAVLGAW
jgi:secretion/DNA translocation related CpaE-like protein